MSAAGTPAIAIVGAYVGAHLLILAAAALLAAIHAINRELPRPLTFRHMLVVGRLLAVMAIALPIIEIWHEGGHFSPLRAQVWAAPSVRAGTTAVPNEAWFDIGVNANHAFLPLSATTGVMLLIFASGVLITLLPTVSAARRTYRAIRNAHVLRSARSLRIVVSDDERVPFAVWIPGRSYIVVPAALLLRPDDMRFALKHEGQHHRQRDTRYVYVALLGHVLFGFNPAARWLGRQLSELQEFACDETLALQPNHRAEEYCACLLRVAAAALGMRRTSFRSCMANRNVCALRRRVEAAMRPPTRPLGARTAACFALGAAALFTVFSAVLSTPIQDRRLSRADAEHLVASKPESSILGLKMNDAVLKQLNLLLGTPDGRLFLRSSIARMRVYEAGVRSELKRYGLPAALAAVPLVESGYRNLPARVGPGAGLWMFIGSTARAYGLHVSGQLDERLNIPAESRAATHMFSDLRNQFGNWPLALMAYNSGVSRVQAGMDATHSRDAWTLYRAGYGNDPDYLARTAAVMLILAHPQLLH